MKAAYRLSGFNFIGKASLQIQILNTLCYSALPFFILIVFNALVKPPC